MFIKSNNSLGWNGWQHWQYLTNAMKEEVRRHFLFKIVEIFQYDSRPPHYLKIQNWRGKYFLYDFSELIDFGSFSK